MKIDLHCQCLMLFFLLTNSNSDLSMVYLAIDEALLFSFPGC
jgi:hypothetical protein